MAHKHKVLVVDDELSVCEGIELVLSPVGYEVKKALTGEANSKFIYSGSVFSLLSVTPAISCHLRTYIPFRQVRDDGKGGIIMGVIEIGKD